MTGGDRPSSPTDEPVLEPLSFESSRWSRLPLRLRTAVFVAALSVLTAAGVYDAVLHPYRVPPWGITTTPMEYLFYASLMVLAYFLIIPLTRRPDRISRLWWEFRKRPLALVSLGYLGLFVILGTLGPWAVDRFAIGSYPSPYPPPRAQPPVWGTVFYDGGWGSPGNICLGAVRGESCFGTWYFPLGTTVWGADLIDLLAEGFTVALHISLVTAAIIVPIATIVGTAAAYYGGWLDEVLMRYVDVQMVIPAVFLIIVVQYLFGRSLLHIVLVFGLLNWGGTARIVRAEALQRVEEGYVRAAESAGAGSLWVLYRHVIPNVSNSLVTAVTLQMPTLIIAEATISFLGYGSPLIHSWGATIKGGLGEFPTIWWTAVFPAMLLFLTAVSFHVFGDALRDVTNPRAEGGP